MKKKILADIAYCRILNDKLRKDFTNYLSGFITAFIICCVCLALSPLLIINALDYPLIVGFYIGLDIFAISMCVLCIYKIVLCAKELKKCDEMDELLDKKEEELE